jgi:hypothetical protein
MGVNGKSASKQQSSPSSNDRSTSLVDQSSATDFVSTALNLIPVGTSAVTQSTTGASTSQSTAGTGSGTVTASLYSLLAALNKKSITDPDFYKEHTAARAVSITVGTTASNKSTDNTDKSGTVIGLKWAVINQRDLYSASGQKGLKEVRDALVNEAKTYPLLLNRVQLIVFSACAPDGKCRDSRQPVLNSADLTKEQAQELGKFVATYQKQGVSTIQFSKAVLDQVDELILNSLGPFREYQEVVNKAYDRIHHGRQLALSYQVVKRVANGYDNHRAEFIYDYGLSDSITWTVNGSADYVDRKVSTSSVGGRFATDFKGRLTSDSGDPFGKGPIWLSLSGEAKWLTRTKPEYSFQTTLTVPIQTGIDFPIVYRWANRAYSTNQSSSEVHMGLNVDFGRLAQLLRP